MSLPLLLMAAAGSLALVGGFFVAFRDADLVVTGAPLETPLKLGLYAMSLGYVFIAAALGLSLLT
jgi:hypothetical protein